MLILKSWAVVICVLISLSILAEEKGMYQHQPSVYEVTPINSPVKGSVAKFSLKLPAGFELDNVKVKLVNANDLKKDQKKFEDIAVAGNELKVGVSKLPPGFYRLYVKVRDKKNKSEHEFKTKYHDYARFVIDESLQVPVPDSTKNNVTIAGVDSDNDGIRDDVQRFINQNYGTDLKTKLALRQWASSLQMKLTTINDKTLNVASTHTSLEALMCAGATLGRSVSRPLLDKIETKYLNTSDRLMAAKQASINFRGELISSPDDKINLCQFSIVSP